MSGETAKLKNGSTHGIAAVAITTRNLKQYVFDDKETDFEAFKAAVSGPDRIYRGPNAESLKVAGLLENDGTVKPIVVDVMDSIKTPEGFYGLATGSAFAVNETSRAR